MSSVGTNPARPDGPAKVTGSARYVDDITVAGMWHGATVWSERPSARITVDASALDDADVVIVTATDLPGPNVLKVIAEDWPVLAEGEVRHVAEPIALVAARTRAAAKAAAKLIHVDYEDLPAELDLDQALAGSGRVLASCNVDHGDVDEALGRAAHIVEGTYDAGHQEHVYIEPQGMIAIPHEGAIELVGSMQCPYYIHKAMLHLFGCDEQGIRVRQAVTGGGFGGKEDFPSMVAAHAALLARKAGRPVKVIYDRHEDLIATTKRHPARMTHRTGVDAEGRLLAMDIDVLLDGGAYTTLSPVVLSRAVLHAAGAYACPNVRIRGRVLATNTATNGAFRGFGAPQTQFAAERQMDRIARVVGLDPLTIRERNAYRIGDVTPTGQVLRESVSALECLREAEEHTNFRSRWQALEEERRSVHQDDGTPQRGIGLSLCWHGTGFTGNGERLMRAPAAVRLVPGGRVEVLVSSTDFGQGTEIVLAQIVADAAGITTREVDVVQADTALVPDSGPTVASRTVMVVGGVLERAARKLAATVQAHAPEASFAAAGDAYLAANGALEVVERYEDDGPPFDESTYRGEAYAVYGWGANVIEVEVDPDTLITRPTKATLICDVGKAIHPVLCAGQVEGGSLQAFGWGYLEEIKLENGRYLNDTLSTYIIPTALDAPDMETVLLEHPGGNGPGGAKGVGEIPMDGGAPALVAAIENATGIAATGIPATPERLLEQVEREGTP